MHGGFAETLTGTPQGGVASPLLANVYLSVPDRHFARIWDTEMSPPWRRQYRRRTGRPNFRLVRYADDFVRHEALCDRVGVKGHHRRAVAAIW